MIQMCRAVGAPVYVTDEGHDDMVVMSKTDYDKKLAILDIYEKLAVSEDQYAQGMALDARAVLKEVREKYRV